MKSGPVLLIGSTVLQRIPQQVDDECSCEVPFRCKNRITLCTFTFDHFSVRASILQLILRGSDAPPNGCVIKLDHRSYEDVLNVQHSPVSSTAAVVSTEHPGASVSYQRTVHHGAFVAASGYALYLFLLHDGAHGMAPLTLCTFQLIYYLIQCREGCIWTNTRLAHNVRLSGRVVSTTQGHCEDVEYKTKEKQSIVIPGAKLFSVMRTVQNVHLLPEYRLQFVAMTSGPAPKFLA
ncbi:hypothetical protein ANN_02679 [Periplaneta americana]|uniref:Uncharacterized protein n=1 Tax=Periplaneta americana TaxID=6978 RepID=A0ABQ8U0G4_PERAM|nr:hypothetical protein ANN_02679 [Periplaneta americana]